MWNGFIKGAQFVKDNVDKDTVKLILKTGVNDAVPDDYKDLAKFSLSLGVDVGYGSGLFDNVKKGVSFVKDNVDKETVRSVINKGVNCAVLDDYKGLAKAASNVAVDVGYDKGLKIPKFTKGSPEGKDFMAMIQ